MGKWDALIAEFVDPDGILLQVLLTIDEEGKTLSDSHQKAPSESGVPAAEGDSDLPDWFVEARGRANGRYGSVEHDGCRIAYQTWGRAGSPPLLMLHGAGASSEWWEATALFLADRFHIVAPSVSGVGRSQWRDSYRIEQSVEEALACAVAGGVAGSGIRPICVAHSFGSEVGVRLAVDPARPISQLILVDSILGFDGSDEPAFAERERQFYPSLDDAARRFSTLPRDDYGPKFLRRHVARQSLERVTLPSGEQLWSWRADPNVMTRLVCAPVFDRIGDAQCLVDFIYGEQSSMNSAELREQHAKAVNCDATFFGIEDAGHHIPVDQPEKLALGIRHLAALRK
ncbi:MAG: alpha/beta hydrolase [Sphingomonadaceae bacterium]|nr:alpha/beta hydrolase [Sphingomonadaceae bacterium]